MYVSGFSSATRWPSTRTSATWPLNFPFHEPPCRRASSSTTIQPTLCRVRAYSRPGLPRPTTSRSSDEARSPRRQGRRTQLALGGAGRARGVGRRLLGLVGRTLRPLLGGRLALRNFLALLGDLLGLDLPRRQRNRCENRLFRVVEERDSVDRREIGDAQRVADRHVADVELDMLRNLHRQRLDIDLPLDLREDAALLRPRRLA